MYAHPGREQPSSFIIYIFLLGIWIKFLFAALALRVAHARRAISDRRSSDILIFTDFAIWVFLSIALWITGAARLMDFGFPKSKTTGLKSTPIASALAWRSWFSRWAPIPRPPTTAP